MASALASAAPLGLGAGRMKVQQPRMRSSSVALRATAAQAPVSPSLRSGLVAPGVGALGQSLRSSSAPSRQRLGRASTVRPQARAKDPDSMGIIGDDPNREPPNLLWRVFASIMYVIPWIDCLTLGRALFHSFPQTYAFYLIPTPFVQIYYANNFMPLIVFFLCFLAIVKNTKLHHFVRFNTMQAIMLDIGVMLFNILRAYFPAELRWSIFLTLFDKFAFCCCISTILYGVFWTLRGYYADIPFVSEAVYIQVEASEYS